jgi:pimeloyl-ACP methyl ester carboxylesterase
MKSLKLWTVFVIITLFFGWNSSQWFENIDDITLTNGSRLEWTPCWFNISFSQSITKRIRCAYLFSAPNVQLPVVTITNRFRTSSEGPVLYLTGGPGYPTGLDQEGLEFWLYWLEINKFAFDLVLFDPRGTGLGQPRLECPEVTALVRQILGDSLTLEAEFGLAKKALEQCYFRLRDNGIDLTYFTTTQNSRDVVDLMEALGGDNWNLYGSSYGTRVALSVLRDYPAHVRTVILDGVYPPEVDELLEMPYLYHNALSTLFKGCRFDVACHTTFPNLENTFFKLIAQLRQSPIPLTVSEPETKELVKVMINDQRLLNIVFQALYRWDFIAKLPLAIESAQAGNYNPLIPLVEDFVTWQLDTDFSDAVYYSTECSDNLPLGKADYLAQVAQFPSVREFVQQYWDYNLCQIWPISYANPSLQKPVTSDIPTLFLAGEYDPVTPPKWAKKAANRFKYGYFFVFPGIGHGSVNSDHCAPMIVLEFLQNPKIKPEHECLFELIGPEFILNEN